MMYWELVFESYLEMRYAAEMAHQECMGLIDQRRFDEAEQAGKIRDRYFDCALTAIHML